MSFDQWIVGSRFCFMTKIKLIFIQVLTHRASHKKQLVIILTIFYFKACIFNDGFQEYNLFKLL